MSSRRAYRRVVAQSRKRRYHRCRSGDDDSIADHGGKDMPFLSGKQAFLQILKQEGVSVMFGNPGTTEHDGDAFLLEDLEEGVSVMFGNPGTTELPNMTET